MKTELERTETHVADGFTEHGVLREVLEAKTDAALAVNWVELV